MKIQRNSKVHRRTTKHTIHNMAADKPSKKRGWRLKQNNELNSWYRVMSCSLIQSILVASVLESLLISHFCCHRTSLFVANVNYTRFVWSVWVVFFIISDLQSSSLKSVQRSIFSKHVYGDFLIIQQNFMEPMKLQQNQILLNQNGI